MAHLFPDAQKTQIIFPSSAEKLFYERSIALSDSWRVYYSRTLSTMDPTDGQKDNEIDFVLYHPSFGIIVIEVKGGRIRFNAASQEFFSINRHGEEFPIKNPFSQALVWKSRFVKVLRQRHVQVPVTHAVCFPSIDEEALPEIPGTNKRLIIGRQGLDNLEECLNLLAKDAHPEKYLDFPDCKEKIDAVLVGRSFKTKDHLKDYLIANEGRLIDVQTMQETLLPPLLSKKRLAIEGEAGTGKTILAALLAKHLHAEGKSVLFLISNPAMTDKLREYVPAAVEIASYPELADRYEVNLLMPPADYRGSQSDWMQYEAPERLKRAILAGPTRFDALIFDEAQDIQPFWWEALEALLVSADAANFYVFFDRSQGVFGSGGVTGHNQKYDPEQVIPIERPYFPLVNNYRITREIAAFSRSFRNGDAVFQSYCGRIGLLPEIITYHDEKDSVVQLSKLIKRLTEQECLLPSDVTLLSFRNPKSAESTIKNINEIEGFPLETLTERIKKRTAKSTATPATSDDEKQTLCVSTIAGFKGMETPVGILLNLSEYNLPLDNAIMASLIYVACTRARHMLYIMVQKDDPKRKALQDALRQVSQAGMIVLDREENQFEFTGIVTHYNPERVGWLSVDDRGAGSNAIMFFPHDVKRSAIADLTIGMKLKFRPRVEGFATIATDLKDVVIP